MYPHYRHHLTTRSAISSPLEIEVTCNYDSIANTGLVTATVTNTSGNTVNATIHFAIIENDIPHNWYGMTTVEHVLRDMLPDGDGEAITIPVSDTIIRSRNFSIDGAWEEHNCKIVVFVQGATREIYQGALVAVIEKIDMDYYGQTFTELSGNGNRVAEPGESIRMYIKGKNNDSGNYTGGASIDCGDSYITITSTDPLVVNIGQGEVDTVISCDFSISTSCPLPHMVEFDLDFGTQGDTNTVHFMITNQPGFTDDIESGQNGWTLAGSNNNWHITTHKSHSATHSWYCGIEGSYQYTNWNDASLISPYFVVTPDSSLRFWHQYAMERDYDYAYVEIDNNLGWWQTLDEFNGTQSAWTQAEYSLSAYSGQTVRLRFRFVSDENTVAEGWYVDDVSVPIVVGIEETKEELLPLTLRVSPNPFRDKTNITYQTTKSPKVVLKIYDATGRLIKEFDNAVNGQAIWDATDFAGHRVSSGIYFVQFETDKDVLTEKVLLLR